MRGKHGRMQALACAPPPPLDSSTSKQGAVEGRPGGRREGEGGGIPISII